MNDALKTTMGDAAKKSHQGCCGSGGLDHETESAKRADAAPVIAGGATTMAKDPVCGMDVDPHAAKHVAEYEGRPITFARPGAAQNS